LSTDRVLSIWIPIARRPQDGLPEWTRQEVAYDVLDVTDLCLAISNRRFDEKDVIVMSRVNKEEYDHRKAAERRELDQSLASWLKDNPWRTG